MEILAPFLSQIQEEREALPLKNFENEILDAVRHNSVVVIRGATGCGKTTQVPQYILDEYIRTNRGAECNIVVTQVRNVWPLQFSGGYERSPVGSDKITDPWNGWHWRGP